MYLFIKRQEFTLPTDSTPDPLFNPNEVTRVSDIMELHRKGFDVSRLGGLRSSEITDERSDLVKLESANTESDKLFPSLPRIVQQNAHYNALYTEQLSDIEKQLVQLQNQQEFDNAMSELSD